MFLFCAAQEYPSLDQNRSTPTQKGQEMDYPFRKSSILCCSVI
jgi:hypothetical protein